MKKIIAVAIFGIAAAAVAAEIQWQSIASVEGKAREYAEAHGAKVGVRQQLRAGPLDDRLRLVRCPQALSAAFAPGANTPPRLTVEVRCPSPGGWKVYVPVTVNAFDRAVIATRALERGHLLTAADITLTDSDVSGLPIGYWSDPSLLNGLRVTRPIAVGTVLSPAVVQVDPLVKRGEHVTAVAQLGGIAVHAQALALASGAAEQRIRLKNLASGKEIEGIVKARGLVEISVH